jgi:SM-20-related protein
MTDTIATIPFDYAALARTPLVREPFPYAIVPNFVPADSVDRIDRDWPEIGKPGAFPVSSVTLGPATHALVDTIQTPEFRKAVEEKLEIDLSGHPTMITVRDRCRARDGQIHTDSVTKVVTVLFYLNRRTGGWQDEGGKLRILRGPGNLEDYIAEIPPINGTMLMFRCTRNAWHGHHSYEGPRHVLQLNWMVDEATKQREEGRHKVSAFLKKLNPFG